MTLQVIHILRVHFRVSTNAYRLSTLGEALLTASAKPMPIPQVGIAGIVSPDPPREMHLDSEGQPLRWLRTDKAVHILRRLEAEKVNIAI